MGTPAYIDSTARLFGDVRLGDDCSLWPYAVVRSERAYVSIGRCASVQDMSLIHISEPTRH